MLKTFKFRLNPTTEQLTMIKKHLGCSRFVYNWGLNEKSKAYADNGQKLTCFDLITRFTSMRHSDDHQWLKEIYSQVPQMALRNLDNAFTSFFKKKGNYPTFKKKSSRHQSFQLPQGVKIEDNLIYLPKIGWVTFFKSRDILGKIKTVTVSSTPTGKIYVSILCDMMINQPSKKPVLKETSVGIDLGVKHLAVTSDGQIFENQKYLRNNLDRLRVEQRKLQRAVQGSKNRERQRLIVASLHERISNQRLDYLHKISTELVRRYDTIIMEDLDVDGMMRNRLLSLSIGDAGWSTLNNLLEYKCEWYGKNLIRIGRFDPSSKRCNACGHINGNLTLSDRRWVCPSCGSDHDRDMNAALNIRDYGLGTQPSDAKVRH